MDPISGVASVLAIISAANTTIHGIDRVRSLAKAPKAINGLIDEAEALRRLLKDVQQLQQPIQSQQSLQPGNISKESNNLNPKTESLLSVYLAQAGTKLAELDKLIDLNFKQGAEKRLKRPASARLAWLSSESRVKSLRNDIYAINTSISTCLAMTVLNSQTHLQICLEEMTSGVREGGFQTVLTKGIDNPRELRLDKDDSIGDQDQRHDATHHSITPFPSHLSRSPSQNQNYCESCCVCHCHKRTRIQSSGIFGDLIGSFFLTYSNGFSHLPCNEQSCRRSPQMMLNLTYHFPLWLLSCVFDTYWGADSIGSPTVALRMPRIRPDTAPIFNLAAAGDIAGMQRMFLSGLASPDDVSYTFGYSVLHFAVDMDDVETIKFLIREGANPMLANRLNLTAVDFTWNRILCKRTTATKETELALLFGTAHREDQIQSRRLTRPQQVILGLVDADLEITLNDLSRADINVTDADGNTMLSWAARSCNAAAVRALLRRGAEIHQASRFGSTALHYAASARSPDCIRLLLEAGADPSVRNTCLLETPVHVAALRHDDPERFLAPFFEYGADVDAQDYEGSSALAFAVQANHSRSLKFLLAHGADADVADNSGIPPVGVAVIYKNAPLLQILVESGASIHFTTDTKQTLLHLVALYGDLGVISVLKAADSQLSHEVLDEKGAEALSYAKARGEDSFLAAFTDLISVKTG